MNLICQANENKIMEIPTDEFNKWLKENNVGWEIEKVYEDIGISKINYGNPHEPFSFTMFKKYDIDIIQCLYKKSGGKTYPDIIVFQYEPYKHGCMYNELLNCDKEDKSEYKKRVLHEEHQGNINSEEACYLLELVGLTIF